MALQGAEQIARVGLKGFGSGESHEERQRYCSAACARRARRKSMREAGRRYQQTPGGRRKHASRQAVYLLRRSASERSSGKDDAPGYPTASGVVHTVRADAEGDLGDALRRREPPVWAQTGVRCCLCGAWCLPRGRMGPLRRRG